MGYGYGGYYGAGGYGGYGATGGVSWIYALLILIVIVLQFGRKERTAVIQKSDCCDGIEGGIVAGTGIENDCRDFQAIDNSVIFIIVVFLLAICGGCWGGAGGGYGHY